MWFTLILAVLSTVPSESLRILGIFPMAGKSHFTIGEEVMKSLAQRGHNVDVINHFPQKKPINNYTDIDLSGSIPLQTNNMKFSETKNYESISLKYFVENAGNKICDLLAHEKIQEILSKPKDSYDLVIVEVFAAPCYIAFGRHFNVPVIGVSASRISDWLHASFANPVNTAYMPSLFSSSSQEMTFFERLKNTLEFNWVAWQVNYYTEVQREHVEKYFHIKLSSIQELYSDVSIVLVNSHYTFEISPAQPSFINIGGIHVNSTQELPTDIQKWLDESKNGCVYISMGSMVQIETSSSQVLDSFYEMFERIAPTRVLIKIAKPDLLPRKLPDNVKTSTWLPQIAVLQHKNVKVFVTHGGILGTQESTAMGVPLVGLPLFGDQRNIIKTYAKKKLAVYVDIDTITADSLTNAVDTVLKDPDYQENIKIVSRLFMDRPMSAKDTAVYWVEYTARHGNRLKSPATKLSWWQYYLLDVYGFFIFFILLLSYITKKIIAFFFHRLLRAQKHFFENIKKIWKPKNE